MNYQQNSNEWIPRPLNRKGDLSGWKGRMAAKCPNPSIGQLVWLDKEYTDRVTGEKTKSFIGYKVIGFNSFGDAIWQRGQEAYH
jgi:hypothetical protein